MGFRHEKLHKNVLVVVTSVFFNIEMLDERIQNTYGSYESKEKPPEIIGFQVANVGGDYGTRTCDLMRVKHAL